MVAFSTITPPPPSTTNKEMIDGTISTLHPDILQTHILTRLDGPTLVAAACASTELHALSAQDELWQKICTSTWPSINEPVVQNIISTFPHGHRSFFSDSYPLLHYNHHHSSSIPTTTECLISAVDIYYQNVPIFSKVVEIETLSGWFMCSPFRVDLLEPKEYVETWIQHRPSEKELSVKQLEEDLTLSWILIDPKRRRAMNLSSEKPVSVQRHWLTGEVVVKFANIMAGEGKGKEFVDCGMVVTCGEKEGGEVQVREVSMGMEDMEGRSMCGKDSLVILQGAMERGERRKGEEGKEGKERYEEFVEMKNERKERNKKREKVLDMACVVAGITVFVSFWSFILFR